MTKYEALEKNAVSEPEMPQLENLQYSPIRRNGSLCWGIFGLSHGPQCKDRAMVAEGEELGSNLLRVAQSSPWAPGGPWGSEAPNGCARPHFKPPRSDREMAVTIPQPASTSRP
jgi:hypothetical protein